MQLQLYFLLGESMYHLSDTMELVGHYHIEGLHILFYRGQFLFEGLSYQVPFSLQKLLERSNLQLTKQSLNRKFPQHGGFMVILPRFEGINVCIQQSLLNTWPSP